jgi:hypothetical protein
MVYLSNWGRLAILAGAVVAIFGALYWASAPTQIRFAHAVCATGEQVCEIAEPWIVAALGFATFGILDPATPQTGLGQLIMIANALMGFVMLCPILANLIVGLAGESGSHATPRPPTPETVSDRARPPQARGRTTGVA